CARDGWRGSWDQNGMDSW
nr:immunoglobulin heavy chain junction region [Macaca mulatta]